jgi:hypothetical protein
MDETIGTLGLHLAAAILALAFTWFLPREIFEAEIGRSTTLNRLIFTLCKYIIPAVLIITIVVHLFLGFEFPDATYIAGMHFLNAWLQAGGLATFIIGILVMILIIEKIRS